MDNQQNSKKIVDKISLKENNLAYQQQLQIFRGKISSDSLVAKAQTAMDILDASEEFGSFNDWMVFFSAFKTYGISPIDSLTTLHQQNKVKSAGRATETSRRKLDEKFEVMKRASIIVLKEYKDDMRALDYGIIIRTAQYKNATANWLDDFALAFPQNKADLYSKLAFSMFNFPVMSALVVERTLMFCKIYLGFRNQDMLEMKRAGQSYLGRSLLTAAWVIKESESKKAIAIMNLTEVGTEQIDATKDKYSKTVAKDLLSKEFEGPRYLKLLASGIFDVRKLKQSPDYKMANPNRKKEMEMEIASIMLSIMNVVDDQGDKWSDREVTLETESAFSKAYYLAFQILQNTHTCFVQKFFPRAGARGMIIPLSTGELSGDMFGKLIIKNVSKLVPNKIEADW